MDRQSVKTVSMARRSLRYVMNRYFDKGIILSYTPRVEMSRRANDKKGVYAAVDREMENFEKMNEFLTSSGLAAKFWKRYMGVDVSDGAYMRWQTDVNDTMQSELLKKIEDGSDESGFMLTKVERHIIKPKEIRLYSPSHNLSNVEMNTVMAHEHWHLQEIKDGVFDETPMITEGTATYASLALNGKELNHMNPKNMTDVVYIKCAEIIGSMTDESENPFKMILDRGFRKEANHEYASYVTNELPEEVYWSRFETSLWNNEKILTRALVPSILPPKNPSEKQIMGFLKKFGNGELAKELEGQDMEKLYAGFKRMYK